MERYCYNLYTMKVNRFIFLLLSFILSFSAIAYAEDEICAEPYSCLNNAMEVYRGGKTEDAIQLFKDIIIRFEDPEVVGISSFMAGSIMARSELLAESGAESLADLGGSEEYLEQAYSKYPLLGDYALFTLAGVYEKKGDYNKAAELYRKIFITYPDSALQKKSLIRAADNYLTSGDIVSARDTYETFISKFHRDKSAPNAMYGIAVSYLLKDNTELAYKYLNKIWIEYPASPVSYSAKKVMNWLKSNGYEPPPPESNESFTRGERLFNAGLYEDAAAEYKRFLSHREGFSEGKERDAYYKLSLSYYNARILKEAEDSLEFFLNNYSDDKRSCEVIYSLARNYLREGKDDAFVKSGKAYIKLCRGTEKIPEVTYRLGMFYAEKKDIKSAFGYFDRVIRKYSKSDFASDSRWAKGWLLYKEQKFAKALKVFDSLLKDKRNPAFIPKALYWKARILETMGDHDGMEKSLCQLCNNHNGSFYCFFAAGNVDIPCDHSQKSPLLNSIPPENVIPTQVGIQSNGLVLDSHLHGNDGLRSRITITEHGFSDDTPDTKIKLLLYLGFKEEAINEIQRIKQNLKEEKESDRAIALSSILYETGEYNTALSVIYTNFSKEILYSENNIDYRVWRLMYPDGYSALVKKYAEENGVDPFLLFALIREESWFNNEAVSSSGALGLMQVMPKTASSVTNNHDINRNSMFDPELNISIGSKFFSDLLKRFDGNIIYAIASYNAGPNAVTKWVKERSAFDLDEFVEDIPYKETRDYVKKVFSSYKEYMRINSL